MGKDKVYEDKVCKYCEYCSQCDKTCYTITNYPSSIRYYCGKYKLKSKG